MAKRCRLRRDKHHSRQQARVLTRQITRSLKQDRKERIAAAGAEIEACLENHDLQGAWNIARRWYRFAGDRPSLPTRANMPALTQTTIDLYRAQPPADTGIPNVVPRRPVDDSVPQEAEIAAAVRRLRRNKAPGISKMTSNHLKAWMKQALEPEEGKQLQRQPWDTLVQLIQHMWSTGQLPTELTWSIQVLLPKPNGGARCIGLLEVVWKLMEAIIDTRVKEVIEFHDCLHGFRSGRGTDISIIEAKLIQQLAAIAGEALFECFIDLRQAFDSVDHEASLTILEDRGAGPNLLRLLRRFWEQQEIVCRQGGFHGPSSRAGKGTTQGGLFSPTFFDIIIDQVVRYWLQFTITYDHDAATN